MCSTRSTLLAFSLVVFAALPAAAHGPTVRVSFSGVRPAALVVEVGTTVHFHNDGSTPATLAADDASFESPTLAPAEGWHHTFGEAGQFEYGLKESSRARGKIVVYAPD